MEKTLDLKLERLAADPHCGDFILADAKDADMAFGVGGLGTELGPQGPRPRTLDEFRDRIREVAQQQIVDIMLMSVSSSDQLVIREKLFDQLAVTPAIRANDATDIWLAGSPGNYASEPSRPFRTALLDHAMGGFEGCPHEERHRGSRLGLYSITLNHDLDRDVASLQAYAEFRREAELKGFRHFLEVFAPNAPRDLPPDKTPQFVNDSIVRLLAGVARAGRPIFLKIPYFGPAAMEALAGHDRSLIVGILGGSAGTTHDAFHLLGEAKRYGARAALFGRKINQAENQLEFVRHLRLVADDKLSPAEAVRSYHAALAKHGGPAPKRALADDLVLTEFPG
jgi:hypothetical protein